MTSSRFRIVYTLTIQIASHMTHSPVGQFEPHAAAMA